MPRIEWNESFSVGHPEIDRQHQKWVEIHNNLHEILLNASREEVNSITIKILGEMKDYVNQHFLFEEEHLESISYPDKETHVKIHRAFEEMIEKYLNDIRSGKLVLNSEVMRVLKDWLENHILYEDMKYAKFAATSK